MEAWYKHSNTMRHIQIYENYKVDNLHRVIITVIAERQHPREADKTVVSTFKGIGVGKTKHDAATYALAGLHLRLENLMGYGHYVSEDEILNLQDANYFLDDALYKYERSKEETVNDLTNGMIDPNYLNNLFNGTKCTAKIDTIQVPPHLIGGEYTDEEYWVKGEEEKEDVPEEKEDVPEEIPAQKKITPKIPPMAKIRKAIADGDWEVIKGMYKK